MSKARVSQNTDNQNTSSGVPSKSNRNVFHKPSPSSTRGEPWNHKQFLKRVETFNSLKWHIKRTDVTPLLCARYGWQCVEKNTLKCSDCGTKINYKTNSLWSIDTNNKIAKAFIQNIQISHTPDCIWKNNPCSESFDYLPMDGNIMKQELIENIKTWTQTDSHSFYIVPKIDPTAKTIMIKSIESTEDGSWINYSSCCDIMLLSGSGWYLSPLFNNTPYVQCRYCNKCISLQSYDYKKIISLLPDNINNMNNKNNSFLNAINEEEDDNDNNNNNNLNDYDDDDDDDDDDEMEEDVSTILNRELPINDTDSIMHRLSKLGLKIDSNIRRSHNFQIYETKSLQKQAHFNNNPIHSNSSSPPSISSISSTLSLSSSPFGARPFGSNIFNNNSMSMTCSQCMRWPKQSILTQSNSISISQSHSIKNSTQKKQRKNKKRSRIEMSMDDDDEEKTSVFTINENEKLPLKKRKICQSNIIDNNHNNNNKNKNSNYNKNTKPRRNRKRKTMEDSDESMEQTVANPMVKKRRIDTSRSISSVSTTLSLPSSSLSSSTYSTPNNNENKRRSRKRKFNDVFMNDEDNNIDDDDDEDDDIKTDGDGIISICNSRATKRARLDTPTVRNQLYFDPIHLHNEHCPFLLQHKYEQNSIFGWKYCLKLLPNHIMYIQQIAEQSKKTNQAKSRV